MRINELVDAIAAMIQWTFKLLVAVGGFFNVVIIIVAFLLAVIWIKKMFDFNKEAERNGTLK